MNHPSFVVYFWPKPVFQRQDLREAYNLLEKGEARQEQRNEAFKVLLKSNVDIAQGIVFDVFFYWETLARWGIKNPYRTFSTILAGAARRQLRRPPVNSDHVVGANHASALGVLTHLGKPADIALIEPILRTSRDYNVLSAGLFALNLLYEIEAIPQQLVETISRIMVDEDIDPGIRADAIGAFRNVKSLPPEIETLCLQIAQRYSPEQSRLPGEAAWTLCADLPKHRAFLEKLVESWPQDSGYPASEVRRLLEDED